MSSFYVVIEENHPLKELIIKNKIPRGPSPTSCPKDHILVDLRILSFEDRLDDLEGFPGPIIADATTGFLKNTLSTNKNIKALFPSAFFSPTSTYEVWVNPNNANENQKISQEFLSKLDFKTYFVNDQLNYSFILPRIGAMLINEYFFSKEEKLATTSDIDQALKFGVNYPLGPDEWKNKSSLEALAYLLQFLGKHKKTTRYQMADEISEQI